MPKVSLVTRLYTAIVRRMGEVVHQLRDNYYRKKNSGKPRLLVFTDSRGYEVVKPWNRKSAYASYVGKLCKEYHVEHVICPEFSTTVIDFLYEYQSRVAAGKKYDAVIAHVGVVDYSPRPVSMLNDMMAVKGHKINTLFPEREFDFKTYHAAHFAELYYGKPVKNFYSQAFLQEQVIPKLQAIEPLIMVGCSPVLTSWHGNYWRDRPQNMDMILDYSAVCRDNLANFIDYSAWDEQTVKQNTIDNIHLSNKGFDETYSQIKTKLAKLGL
ncbi:hypothetical protein DXX93_05730 [Thalassotalea euphylliae]|uniref:SGNH/GDSL hydrolase family protein n=1 Tax=Thalassotalea euphylliae TaxID=1655234 RepID=A0A3E0TNI5_9GAMM|nr:hypothetical protein [Thalassotalea euphylliae]REL26126.1 hypothetical protein DXX93_05730 [Thalassotalea euphylliae]